MNKSIRKVKLISRNILTVTAYYSSFNIIYCLSASWFFLLDYLIFLVFAYIKYYNKIIGKKVFLCGKNIFQNIDGLIYFGFYLSFWPASILVTMICFLSIIKKSLFVVVSGDLYLPYFTCYLLISLLSRIENKV